MSKNTDQAFADVINESTNSELIKYCNRNFYVSPNSNQEDSSENNWWPIKKKSLDVKELLDQFKALGTEEKKLFKYRLDAITGNSTSEGYVALGIALLAAIITIVTSGLSIKIAEETATITMLIYLGVSLALVFFASKYADKTQGRMNIIKNVLEHESQTIHEENVSEICDIIKSKNHIRYNYRRKPYK